MHGVAVQDPGCKAMKHLIARIAELRYKQLRPTNRQESQLIIWTLWDVLGCLFLGGTEKIDNSIHSIP